DSRNPYKDSQSLRRYRYNLELSSCFYKAFSIFEVALRNNIVSNWSQYFQVNYLREFTNHGDWPKDSRGLNFFLAKKGIGPYDVKVRRHLEKSVKELDNLERSFEHANKIAIRANPAFVPRQVTN